MPIADRKKVEAKIEIFYREHKDVLSKYVAPSMKKLEEDVINELENVSYDVLGVIYKMYDEGQMAVESAPDKPFIYDKAGPGCIAGAAMSVANNMLYGHGITVASSTSLDFERSLEYGNIGCKASNMSKVKKYVLGHAHKMLENIKVNQILQSSFQEKHAESFKDAGTKYRKKTNK